MTTQIPALTFAPYQGGAAGTLIATLYLDSAVDLSYSIPIDALYSNKQITAEGVMVDNTANDGRVNLRIGVLQTSIVPFQRDGISLGQSSGTNLVVDITVGIVQLIFYVGTPPIGVSFNYAGAAAVNNSNVFPGGVTGGTANAQTISVSTAYAFSNGVIISATAGLTNTGPLFLNVNGMGGVQVTKTAPLGEVPLEGGEWQAGANFLVSVNEAAGTLNLVSDIPTPASVKAFALFNGTTGALFASANITSVVRLAPGQYTVTMTNPLMDANYALAGMVNSGISATASVILNTNVARTTTQFTIDTTSGGVAFDFNPVSIIVVR